MVLTEKFEEPRPFGERCTNWSSLIYMNAGRRSGVIRRFREQSKMVILRDCAAVVI